MFLNYCKIRWESFTSIKSTFLVGLLFLCTYQFVGAQIISDAPPPPPLDVELNINTRNVAVGKWKKLPVTVTIKNSGYNVAGTNIIVRIGTCFGNPATVTFDTKKGGIVYANSTASLITTGTFNLFNGTWSIPVLPGESDASLRVDYFTLTDEPIKLFAFVEQMDGYDLDSSPMPYSTDLTCEVTEDDEALLVLNPTVSPFSCEDELTLTTQAEVDAFDCTSFDGALTIIGDDITNLDGLLSLKDNHNGVIYIQKTSIENLNGLANLESSNGLFIIANPNLQQVNLPKLTSLHSLAVIQNDKLTDLKGLASIRTLTGTLTINDNERLVSLEGLDNLTEVRNSIGLNTKIQILDNPLLSDCCVLSKVLNTTQSPGAINIDRNAFSCSSVEGIESACKEATDLELTITSLNRFPKKYDTFPVELTVKNNSTVTATDIQIDAFRICDNGAKLPNDILVLAGGSINTTKGRYGSGNWSINELAAGEEAVLKVSYFVLKEQTFALKAEIAAATPKEDVDSTPRLFSADRTSNCIASEDDEAILAFNIAQRTCDLLTTIDLDPCDPLVLEVATYSYNGAIYLVTTPDRSSGIADLEPSVINCSTGITLCADGELAAGNSFPSCRDFFANATKLEVISSKADCPDCNCPAVLQPVCSTDGITYDNECEAKCAGAIIAFNTSCIIDPPDCDCPPSPLPGFVVGVCGSDGNMYSTGCEAECAGVTWTDGLCITTGITCGEITVTPLIDGMKIDGQAGENYFIKVHRTFPAWEYVYQCSFDCGSEIIIDNLPTATYFVDVYDKSWRLICDDIEVSLIAIDGGFQTTTAATTSRSSLLPTSNLTNNKPLTIYPNPANKQVTFEVDAITYPTAQLYLSNNLGQVVKTIPLAQFDHNPISLDQFQSGIYQVSIVADGRIIAKEKLVVLR